MQLIKHNENRPVTEEQREAMLEAATAAYGDFLTALGFDWNNDAHMKDTPRRVSKAWMEDLISGCLTEPPKVTAFPNDTGFTGLICQTNIPVISMCAHHNLPFIGLAHVAYIPKKENGLVVGLSKLNRIVDHFARRPNVQESLTKQVHSYLDKIIENNRGIAVIVESQHFCVRCRGVQHNSAMVTSEMSGYFHTNEVGTRAEFMQLIANNRKPIV